MSSTVKKVLIVVAVILVAIVGGFLVLAYQFGAFSDVTLAQEVRGPYHIVYLDHTGPYVEIAGVIARVDTMLKGQNITTVAACGLFHDDPAQTPPHELRSQGGFIVPDSLAVQPPFGLITLPEREVLIGTIEAHPALAPFKTYPKMHVWLKENQYESIGAALEIYRQDGIVECQLPIRKVDALSEN